eukprot:2082886-Karenia_brevis.AAC.1
MQEVLLEMDKTHLENRLRMFEVLSQSRQDPPSSELISSKRQRSRSRMRRVTLVPRGDCKSKVKNSKDGEQERCSGKPFGKTGKKGDNKGRGQAGA